MNTSRSAVMVSVIMPAYNRQDTIAYAIESVLDQQYGDFELILVDDASEDATLAIMEYYCRQDSRVFIVRNQDNSRAAAIEWEPRNDGLKVARGRFIAYLDSDNLWDRAFLKTCIETLEENPQARLVHCNSRNHYRDTAQYELVLEHDRRELIESSESDLTAVFSYRRSDRDNGVSWYIDTNEMVHRADVFRDLHYLWATRHPDRATINAAQLVRCTYRRHNDQELAERIIDRYGRVATKKIEAVLVDFFYAPTQHRCRVLRHRQEIERLLGQA